MLSAFTSLRALALLRQIARSLARLADSQETLARVAVEREAQSVRPPAKKTLIAAMDTATANAQYRRRVMEEKGLADEEEYEEFMGRS